MHAPIPEENERQRAVQSVAVGGRLLIALSTSEHPLPLKELAARSGLTASRAHPYLVSYQRLALVEQDRETGYYALGPAALQIGLAALHQLDTLKVAGPVAETLAHDTGHAVALAVWGNLGPTVVRLVEARHPLHVVLRVGSVMSVFGTSTGRAFASVMPPEWLARSGMSVVGEGPERKRPWKLPLAKLQQVKEEMASYGVTRAQGSPIPGVNAFSAPALDHEGFPALVVTAIDHEERLDADWHSPAALAVRQAADLITRKLGGSVRA